MDIKLEVTAQGGIRMLHDDAVDLTEFGKVEVTRASNVEFNNVVGHWYIQSVKTGYILRDDFKTRKEALDWEKVYYSPGQPGWRELVGED